MQDILARLQIDRQSPIPIYRQLQAQLEQFIMADEVRADAPLPSDNALAETLHVSVMTVRQAMGLLVAEGLIYREKGRGTFISPRPLEHHLQRLESFSEDMRERGLEPTSRILAFEQRCPPEAVAQRLNLAHGEQALFIKRLRFADKRAVAVHDAYILRAEFTRAELEKGGSLYAVLAQHGVQLVEADETLEAVAADAETAALLTIDEGAPLLKATRLSWDQNRVPVEWVRALYRADFYRYAIRLRR